MWVRFLLHTAGGLGAVSKMPFDGQDISMVKKGRSGVRKCLLTYTNSTYTYEVLLPSPLTTFVGFDTITARQELSVWRSM